MTHSFCPDSKTWETKRDEVVTVSEILTSCTFGDRIKSVKCWKSKGRLLRRFDVVWSFDGAKTGDKIFRQLQSVFCSSLPV